VPGADGIKTGFTREAGYTFVGSAKRGERRLVIVLAGAPSARVRNQTARDLMRWGFDTFNSEAILPGELAVGHARVQNGAKGEVALETAGEVLASVPPGGRESIAYSIRYRGPVEAPIAKGQQVAWLHVTIPGQQPHDVPLVAAEAVPEANLFQRLVNGVVGLVT
jgi:D-alanyl-D-alanine carboxypeptidase (penicillin-binding protein 5/6)